MIFHSLIFSSNSSFENFFLLDPKTRHAHKLVYTLFTSSKQSRENKIYTLIKVHSWELNRIQ